jgi:hypothetical protein
MEETDIQCTVYIIIYLGNKFKFIYAHGPTAQTNHSILVILLHHSFMIFASSIVLNIEWQFQQT